jgi:hypothetical protein
MIKEYQRFALIDYETTGVDPDRHFPIEVGIMICDHAFSVLDTYEAMIRWDIDHDDYHQWLPNEQPAYSVHKIPYAEWDSKAQHPSDVVHAIDDLCKKHRKVKNIILLSDNIQFEWSFTKKLYSEVNKYKSTVDEKPIRWPFHYCGWDSSLLLEMTGVGDPIPEHRAFRDVSLLQQALVRALERSSNG